MPPRAIAERIGTFLAVLCALWGAWEGWRWLGSHYHLTWPFAVNDTTMPHLHRIIQALFQPAQANGPSLLHVLLNASAFTAKEAALGFALGAVGGFAIAVVLMQSRFLERGIIPYVVASQTIPLLAIAPMVIVGLESKFGGTLSAWECVSVLAAYLTFFPVTINALRGLQSADPRAVELMRSYAASRWRILWKLQAPASLPYLFSAFRIAAPLAIVGAIISEPSASIQGGLGGAIVNFNQYYSIEPQELWATNVISALLGIAFFLVVVFSERLIVQRAPEHTA
ncbi:MAG TPA: ABC transporter permease subunit [Gaiellaceae bacterium]|nr:ABC transporter permease subunit [Gaiellaceae bacterium]